MTANIHTAINQVMQGVGYVKKEKGTGVPYTFAGESALIQALRPSMVANEIYMHVAEIKNVEREQYTTTKGTQMVNTVMTGIVRFTHAPTDTHIDVWATGEGSDAGDKSANKALTGMFKYAMRQTFMIETGDDPDKHASEERVTTSKITTSGNGKKVEMTEQEKKQAAIESYSKLVKHARTVNLDIPPLDAGLDSAGMKAQYQEQYKFVSEAEAQAKVGV